MFEPMQGTGQGCPGEELLLAFVMSAVDAETATRLDDHLDRCDACLGAALHARSRLSLEGEMTVPVPVEVRQRVADTADSAQFASDVEGERSRPATRKARVWRLPLPRPLPYGAPLALAAGLLLVVTAKIGWLSPQPGQRLTRAVSVSQALRVSAREASLHKEPSTGSEIVATVRKGDLVTIGGEDREWYRITAPDGTEGWIAQEAFR